MKRICSIQGGGIRGIIPCCALVELERQTGRLSQDVFDWIGGTSTGALLTAAVAAGIPAEQSLKVYTDRGREIFSPTNGFLRKANLVRKGRQFDNRVLHKVVVETLGSAAGWTINQCPISVMITAGDQAGNIWYFVKDRSNNSRKTGDCLLVDAAVASACATTYHDPWLIPDGGNFAHGGYFADGGTVGLADPVYELCVEAFVGEKCYGDINPTNDVKVISLGTGYYQPQGNPDPPGNLFRRIAWVTSALVGASKSIAQQAMELKWPNRLHHPFNPPLPTDIDEADVDKIPKLLEVGQQMASAIDWRAVLEL